MNETFKIDYKANISFMGTQITKFDVNVNGQSGYIIYDTVNGSILTNIQDKKACEFIHSIALLIQNLYKLFVNDLDTLVKELKELF